MGTSQIWTSLIHLIRVTNRTVGVWMKPERESDETAEEEAKKKRKKQRKKGDEEKRGVYVEPADG